VNNREEAEWEKKPLNQAGMPCYFGRELAEDVGRVPFTGHEGFWVQVLRTDFQRARHALEGFDAHFGKQEEEIPGSSIRCPGCHSTEIVFLGLDSDTTEEHEETVDTEETEQTATEHTGPAPKFNWSCDACGYQWKDDGVESKS